MTAIEVKAPRLNANGDHVKISRLLVKPGEAIAAGALLAEIESDKTTFEVCAESAGFVVRIEALEGRNGRGRRRDPLDWRKPRCQGERGCALSQRA